MTSTETEKSTTKNLYTCRCEPLVVIVVVVVVIVVIVFIVVVVDVVVLVVGNSSEVW